MNKEQERFERLVNHWAPAFSKTNESWAAQVSRAFLMATACAADQKLVLDGKEPIRPLDSYPNPRAGF